MNRIYVFTSTGNGLKLAKNLAAAWGDTEILSIPPLMKESKWSVEGQRVGFVFPCYYGTIPQLVKRFISEASSIEGDYFFSLVSAGRSTGVALQALNTALVDRDKKLDYGRSILMASNYMDGWYYSLVMPGEKKLQQLWDQADHLSRQAAREIQEGISYCEGGSYINYLIPQSISPRRYTRDTRPWDREFSVDKGCSGCGTCAKACPVDNITIKEGRPEFRHNCHRCMGCVQFCPQQAFSIRGRGMDKKPYSHRDISPAELFRFHRQGLYRVGENSEGK